MPAPCGPYALLIPAYFVSRRKPVSFSKHRLYYTVCPEPSVTLANSGNAVSDTLAKRKVRGAFFTPPQMTEFIVDWAVRSGEDSVLEPSCGEAAFLVTAATRLAALKADGLPGAKQIVGVDVHADSANQATRVMQDAGFQSEISVSDFFDVEPEARFDAVVGNPPYVRYQDFAGDNRVKGLEAALTQGVRLSGLTSSWAPFVVHASRFLKPTGRLGLVLPAELLTVNYAAEVRRFLLKRFRSVKLVMFEARVFPEVLEDVVLLLAEGEGPAPHFEVSQAYDLSSLADVEKGDWTWFAPDKGAKWTSALLSTESVKQYNSVSTGDGFTTLLDWGQTSLGSVTGNNKYFTLTQAEVKEWGIHANELRRISPPGSRHLRGLSFSETSWKELGSNGARCYLFAPSIDRELSEGAASYIAHGLNLKVEHAYKCRNRKPWWKVPIKKAPDILLTYMDHVRPRMTTNLAGVAYLNSLYGIELKADYRKVGMDLLPLAAINSLTLLGAEMVGRAYGGGLLKLEPTEADKLPLPSPDVLLAFASELRALRPQVNKALGLGKLFDAVKLIDRVLLVSACGLVQKEINSLRESREVLFGRRESRSRVANVSD
ncbi:MAG: N-6 DNA methylase [Gemmatimonadaceae bacterium]|nr:N-6 DNA methylase [Gemmatimonadaceae bacterium]